MNNGVNNTNTTQTNSEPTLTPMAGVTVAPAVEQPVNASNSANNTSVVNAAPTTVINRQQPVIQPQVQPQIASIPEPPKVVKVKSKFAPILIILVLGLLGYTFYSTNQYKQQISNLKYNCTPITASNETKLDINSTLVQDLYSKVKTNIREDIANPNFDDSMKLYLAYRQIKDYDKYDSNCNLFSSTAMEPYTCEVSTQFVPKAFKEEILTREIKKLYGEETNIPLKNIQLSNSCIVGYQYIQSRGEYVEGYCKQSNATSFKVTKTLKEAKSTRNTIILKEEVKYHENEKLSLPDTLKSGIYYYTFRLDMNYNYVLVSKTYENKYE